MNDDDDTMLLWIALGVAVLYFVAQKFGNTPTAAAPPLALPPAGGSTSTGTSSSAAAAAATAAANADAIANFDPTPPAY